MNESKFSEKEKQFFLGCGFKHYIDLVERDLYTMSNFYNRIASLALYNYDKLSIGQLGTLRKLLIAWESCDPLRITKKFDDLIEL